MPPLEERCDALDRLFRFAVEAVARYADHLDAVQLERLVADAIFLEGEAAAVGLEDVEFDGEALWLPVDVELVAGEVVGGRRSWKACLFDEIQEASLQAGAGEQRRTVERERPAQAGTARMVPGAREERVHRTEVEETMFFASLEHAIETRGREDGGKVEEGARHGGDWDALADRAVVLSQGRIVAPKIGSPTAVTDRRRDVELPWSTSDQSPEPTRGKVAHHSALAAREYRRQAVAVPCQARMPDGVNPAMEAMQTPRSRRVRDLVARVAQPQELSRRDNAVLSLSQLRKPKMAFRSPFAGHRPIKGERRVGLSPYERIVCRKKRRRRD